MKQIFTSIQKEANKILLITILAGTMAACDSVLNYDDRRFVPSNIVSSSRMITTWTEKIILL